jgi:hypothetical protein
MNDLHVPPMRLTAEQQWATACFKAIPGLVVDITIGPDATGVVKWVLSARTTINMSGVPTRHGWLALEFLVWMFNDIADNDQLMGTRPAPLIGIVTASSVMNASIPGTGLTLRVEGPEEQHPLQLPADWLITMWREICARNSEYLGVAFPQRPAPAAKGSEVSRG